MKKNAFTLIELIAVIVILSIVLTLSVPSLIGALKNNKEKSLEKIKLEDIKPSSRKYPYINFEIEKELENIFSSSFDQCNRMSQQKPPCTP